MRLGHHLKEIRADKGATFGSAAFAELCIELGITVCFSAPYTSHQNALAERPWRTMADMTRCLLVTTSLPRKFWEFAFRHLLYLHKRILRYGPNDIPITLATGVVHDLSHARIFGCNAYTHVDSALRRKLNDKA
jgi:transposase InsO family protein